MRYRVSFFLCIFCVCLLVSCPDSSDSVQGDSIVVASWNVQNIFDSVDDGTEYSEYTSAQGWNSTYYKARLKAFSEVVGYDFMDEASVIILNEVENENVVSDILNIDSIKKKGFRYYACASEEDGAISVAVISKIPVSSARIHSFQGSRPVVEVELIVSGKQIYIFALHAKSNLGDDESNKQRRLELAEFLRNITELRLAANPQCGIIIAGDFNENYSDANMMVDSKLQSSGFSDCPLKVSDDSYKSWYCMWLDDSIFLNAQGSCYFVQQWQQYDNILVKNMKVTSANVVFEGILKSSSGYPARWDRSILSGVSDHLPVFVEVLL